MSGSTSSKSEVQGSYSPPLTVRVCPLCGGQGVQLAHGRCVNECRDEDGVIPPMVDVEVVPREVAERYRDALALLRGYVAGGEARGLIEDALWLGPRDEQGQPIHPKPAGVMPSPGASVSHRLSDPKAEEA